MRGNLYITASFFLGEGDFFGLKIVYNKISDVQFL
jgi:hypothetical protein